MARKIKKSTKPKIKDLFKKFKIRECEVSLVQVNVTNSVPYRNALFRKYGIRDCFVQIDRVKTPKKLLTTPKTQSVRSECSWLPNVSSTEMNSAEALSDLGKYQNAMLLDNEIPKPAAIRRRRAISLYATRADNLLSSNDNEASKQQPMKQATMQEMHDELVTKFGTPNRGLRRVLDRPIQNSEPQQPHWKQLYEEFQAKIAARKAKQDQQSA